MPNSQRLLTLAMLAALLAAPASAQSFYPTPDASKQRRLELQTQEEARRQRIVDRKERIAAEEARQQSGVRLTDRDTITVQRRYGNAIPNRQGDTESTTVRSTGNRAILVPQR